MSATVILVVEDEPLVRFCAVDMFVTAGYTVLDAANAEEALKILEQRGDVSVVFTDVNMPGSMDGLKLVEAIGKRWPPIMPIVTSGKNVARNAELPKGTQFIAKPYTSEQVLSAVNKLAA